MDRETYEKIQQVVKLDKYALFAGGSEGDVYICQKNSCERFHGDKEDFYGAFIAMSNEPIQIIPLSVFKDVEDIYWFLTEKAKINDDDVMRIIRSELRSRVAKKFAAGMEVLFKEALAAMYEKE